MGGRSSLPFSVADHVDQADEREAAGNDLVLQFWLHPYTGGCGEKDKPSPRRIVCETIKNYVQDTFHFDDVGFGCCLIQR